MALKLLEHTPPTGMKMTLILSGENREELNSRAAVDFAKAKATELGFQVRGQSAVPFVYPVNAAGEATQAVALGQEPIAAWHGEYKLAASI